MTHLAKIRSKIRQKSIFLVEMLFFSEIHAIFVRQTACRGPVRVYVGGMQT